MGFILEDITLIDAYIRRYYWSKHQTQIHYNNKNINCSRKV